MCQDEKTTVNLRIEGETETIFEGFVTTCGHRVTTRSGKTHHCNGTNNNANPCTGPTCITALDDGNKVAGFDFDGDFYEQYDDFLITSIGNETPTGDNFWVICLNLKPIQVGGCQQKVKKDDQVLFAYATRDETKSYLKLSGPDITSIGVLVALMVTDENGDPVSEASIDGHTQVTDQDGRVFISFPRMGTQKLKARREIDSIRSNLLVIQVLPLVEPPPIPSSLSSGPAHPNLGERERL